MKPTVPNKEGLNWQHCFCKPADTPVSPMGSLLPPLKPSTNMADLLHNCDLPLPQKFFVPDATTDEKQPAPPSRPPDKAKMWAEELSIAAPGNHNVWVEELGLDRGDGADLPRALQLSQTRAREAEAKASALSKRSEQLAAMVQRESLELLAHRRWVRLLEVEVVLLEKEKRQRLSSSDKGGANKEGDGELSSNAAFYVALALCLGVAGVGFATGCRIMF